MNVNTITSYIVRAFPPQVSLRYSGGNSCDDQSFSSLTIQFECKLEGTGVAPSFALVDRTSPCSSVLKVSSIHGCPLECARAIRDGSVCGGHGACEMVPTSTHDTTAQCRCPNGWSGTACTVGPDGIDTDSLGAPGDWLKDSRTSRADSSRGSSGSMGSRPMGRLVDPEGRSGKGQDQAGPGGAAAFALVLLATAGLGAWCRRRTMNKRAMAQERAGVMMMDLSEGGEDGDAVGPLLPPHDDDDSEYRNTVIL